MTRHLHSGEREAEAFRASRIRVGAQNTCPTFRAIVWLTAMALAAGRFCPVAMAGDRRTPPETPAPREIPIKLYQNYLIVVEGRLGTLEHQNLLLDTGTNPSIVDRRVAAKLGLPLVPRTLSLFNKNVGSESALLPSLEFGQVHKQDVTVMVADFSDLGGGLGTRIDAVIGLDVLAATSFTVDFAKRRITFEASAERHTVPFTAGPQFMAVTMTANGRPLHLLFDTGTERLVLFESHLGGVSYAAGDDTGSGHNISGNVTYESIVIAKASLGAQDVGPQRALVVPSQKAVDENLDGLMGVSCLRPRRISFDFQRHLLGWSE